MNNFDVNILKLKKKINYKKKNEVKTMILRSIVQNRKISPTYQKYASYILSKGNITNYKFKHMCLKNNKRSSVYNSFYLSKYAIKNYLLDNKLQNIKINSW